MFLCVKTTLYISFYWYLFIYTYLRHKSPYPEPNPYFQLKDYLGPNICLCIVPGTFFYVPINHVFYAISLSIYLSNLSIKYIYIIYLSIYLSIYLFQLRLYRPSTMCSTLSIYQSVIYLSIKSIYIIYLSIYLSINLSVSAKTASTINPVIYAIYLSIYLSI